MSGAKDLVSAYALSLELQIVARGSSLVCREEELWKQAEGLMRDRDARETHCLGLDPLSVMEESLTAAATTAASTGWVKGRGGLQGLERAFEVLEQASLNLYLCPWREEYKVIKMYSGVFTHHIKPMLSPPQIEKLFGLLGYKPSSRLEQLRLQSHRVSPASQDDLLCLSCAFFLARCECRLLLLALGDYAGEVQWELGVVRERQAGQSLKVALDNTKKMLEAEQQRTEHANLDVEVDLYTDVQENGRQRRAVVDDDDDDESRQSFAWETQKRASPPAIKTQSNGITSLASPSTSMSTREPVCVSTLNCQLTKTPPESHINRSSSTGARQRRRPAEDWQSHSLQVEVCARETEVDHLCSCLQSSHVRLKHCRDCNSLHDVSCDTLKRCSTERHRTSFPDNPTEMGNSGELSPHAGSFRVSVSPSLTSSSAAMSSLDLRDESKWMTAPISYHDCCDLAQPDPQVLCLSCSVFHAESCKGIHYCKGEAHTIQSLGVCSCGKKASRDPLVLCRYCGNEYCRDCWYRNPLRCKCGERLDQSSSV